MLKIIKTLYSKQKTILVCPLIKNACYNKKKLYLHNIFTDCRSNCLQKRGFKLLLYSVTLCATCELQRPYLSHSCLSASKVETKQDPNKEKNRNKISVIFLSDSHALFSYTISLHLNFEFSRELITNVRSDKITNQKQQSGVDYIRSKYCKT